MSGTIGEITFAVMKGRPKEPGMVMDTHERIGVEGEEYRRLGRRSKLSSITTIQTYADASAAQSAAESMAAMEGEVVSLTDALGVEHPYCLVVSVEPDVDGILNPVGIGVVYTDTFRLRSHWQVRKLVTAEVEVEE